MRVLVADDDPISAAVLEALIAGEGHEVTVVHDGEAAWAILSGPDAPTAVFLDWMMPGIDGVELCRRIRARPSHSYTYVAVLSVRNKQRDITFAFQSGADDFITKPYQAAEVIARLKVAERLVGGGANGTGLRRAIEEARSSAGGDLIVRSGDRVGRVIFFAGKVAWAHVSGEPGTLVAMFADDESIGREDIRAVLEECTETGRSFGEVMTEWGLISEARLRSTVLAWIRGKVARIAEFPGPAAIFSPESRSHSGQLLFSPEEVFPAALLRRSEEVSEARRPVEGDPTEVSSLLTPELERAIAASLNRAITIEGALSAAIFDGRTGRCLGARGEAVDLDLVWSKLRLASIGDTWDELEDIIISTRHHIFLLRPYTKAPPRSIFVAIDRASAKLGMARLALAECTRL